MADSVAVYTRVSTEDQAREGYSLEAQGARARAYCEAQGWVIVREYVDDGYTGRDIKRPAYTKMIAERETWDKILVVRMDRIHRNSRNFMGMMDDLRRWGKDFVSATESLDTSTAMGRFVVDMMQRIAQLESEVIGERVYTGMSQKARTGRGILGFAIPFGYELADGRLRILEVEAEIVREVFRRCIRGARTAEVAADLNRRTIAGKRGGRWSHPRILYLLHNPVYAGFLRWDGEVRENGHPEIVPPRTFNRAQVVLRRRQHRATARPVLHLPNPQSEIKVREE